MKIINENAQVVENSRTEYFAHLIDHMGHPPKTGVYYILTGNTGIGKTELVKQLGKILGMPVVIIETPHITEEKIINIPFLKFPPIGGSKRSGVLYDLSKGRIILAQTHLVDLLQDDSSFITDNQYINHINTKLDKSEKKILLDLINYYSVEVLTQLPSQITEIPDHILFARDKFKKILFVDEYWRTVDATIRNSLRGLLDRRMGIDDIPNNVYILFATNIKDLGLQKPPKNSVNYQLEMKDPTKKEFFTYLINKHPNLDPVVLNAFKKNLNSSLFQSNTEYTEDTKHHRTSARRWEQIITYVNAAFLPDKNKKTKDFSPEEVSSLLSAVKSMFTSQTYEIGKNWKIVETTIREILQQKHPEHANSKVSDSTEWRNTLLHQLETKIKMGETRKYVPILMGPPGIGKTKSITDIAHHLNLIPIVIKIDALNLTTQDVTGIPIEKQADSKDPQKLGVQFSKPKLLEIIEQAQAVAKNKWMSDPDISEKQKKEWNSPGKKIKWLLLLDEFNRTSVSVMNNLRSLILEKRFNSDTKLPDDIIMVAAMNPADDAEYASPVTDHMLDAADIIESHASWSKFVHYMNTKLDDILELKKYGKDSLVIAKNIILSLASSFGKKTGDVNDKSPVDNYPFWHDAGGRSEHFSPREYEAIYEQIVPAISKVLKKTQKEDFNVRVSKISNAITDKIWVLYSNWLFRNDVDKPSLESEINLWLQGIMKEVMTQTIQTGKLAPMLDKTLNDPKHSTHLFELDNWDNYVQNFNPTEFRTEIYQYIMNLIEQATKAYDIILKDELPEKVIRDKKIEITNKLISKIERISNELSYSTINIKTGEQQITFDLLDAYVDELSKARAHLHDLPQKWNEKYTDVSQKDWEKMADEFENNHPAPEINSEEQAVVTNWTSNMQDKETDFLETLNNEIIKKIEKLHAYQLIKTKKG